MTLLESYLSARMGGMCPKDAAHSAFSAPPEEPFDYQAIVEKIYQANKIKEVLAALLGRPENYDHLIDLLGDEVGGSRCQCLKSRLLSVDDLDKVDREAINRRYLAKDRIAKLFSED